MKFRQLSVVLIILLLCIILIIGCNSVEPANGPAETVNDFFIHIKHLEIDEATALFISDSSLSIGAVGTTSTEQEFADLSFEEPIVQSQDQSNATVSIKVTTPYFANYDLILHLAQENNTWKIIPNENLAKLFFGERICSHQ